MDQALLVVCVLPQGFLDGLYLVEVLIVLNLELVVEALPLKLTLVKLFGPE